MKWLSLLFSFFLGKFNVARSPGLSLKEGINLLFDELAYRSRKPTMLALGGIVSVAILCGGFFMGLIDITTQYDRDGVVRATASSIAGFALAAIAIGTFTWIFKSAWPGVKAAEKSKDATQEVKPPVHGLEQALTLLVLDFIKEREFKREEHRQTHSPERPPEPKEPPPLYNN